jgi:uncharacterized protein DUF6788
MDTRNYRVLAALRRMDVAHGCTASEAASAREAIKRIEARVAQGEARTRVTREEIRRRGWEFRTCGKKACHCMRGGAAHGPYRYEKRRTGKKVSSIYMTARGLEKAAARESRVR